MERIGRLCVGLGVMWVLIIVGLWLMVGLDRPDEWTPYLDRAISSDLRQFIFFLFTFVVTPVGMLMVLRDLFADPQPLWLKLSAPGVFAAVYVLLLAAAAPSVGQPILQSADPVVTSILPGTTLSSSTSMSWLARFGGLLLVIAVAPGLLGLVLGLLTGESRKR